MDNEIKLPPLPSWLSQPPFRDDVKAYATQAVEAYKQQQGEAVPANCDVRKILLAIVPGDGDGYEVYAKSISDVETKLGNMGEELEDWQLGIKRYPAPAQQPLTDSQAENIMAELNSNTSGSRCWGWIDVIRAVERLHNIGAKP